MRRPEATLDLQLDAETLAPGEELRGRVDISSRKGFDIRVGRVTLECIETFWRREYDPSTRSHRNRKKKQHLVDLRHRFMVDAKVQGGVPRFEEFTFALPEDAPCSVEGKIANVSWRVRVSFNVPGMRDLHIEQPVFVRSRESKDDTDPSHDHDPVVALGGNEEHKLSLEIPPGDWKPGDSIAGSLRLDVVEDSDSPEVRVELERFEEAGSRDTTVTVDQDVLERDGSFRGGLGREWRFALAIPEQLAPSVQQSETHVRWKVKGIFSRTLRRDQFVEQHITVV